MILRRYVNVVLNVHLCLCSGGARELLTSHGSTGKAVTLSDDSYTLTTGQGENRLLL